MSSKATIATQAGAAPTASDGAGRDELRRELERQGVERELAERLATDLAALAGSLITETRHRRVH
jgi:hypothetical protein